MKAEFFLRHIFVLYRLKFLAVKQSVIKNHSPEEIFVLIAQVGDVGHWRAAGQREEQEVKEVVVVEEKKKGSGGWQRWRWRWRWRHCKTNVEERSHGPVSSHHWRMSNTHLPVVARLCSLGSAAKAVDSRVLSHLFDLWYCPHQNLYELLVARWKASSGG